MPIAVEKYAKILVYRAVVSVAPSPSMFCVLVLGKQDCIFSIKLLIILSVPQMIRE